MKPTIEQVTQTESLNCVSACLSMIIRKDVDVITSEFHNAYVNQDLEIFEYLNAHNVPYMRCMADERKLKPNAIYMLDVPSANIELGKHMIIVEMTECGKNWYIFDPNDGKDGRRVYGTDVDIKGWSPQYEFNPAELESYWEGNK